MKFAGVQAGSISPWKKLLGAAPDWVEAKNASRGGPCILVATGLGGYAHGLSVETALAAALTWRGAAVDVLLCDRFLPACQMTKIGGVAPEALLGRPDQERCESCEESGASFSAPLGLETLWYGRFLKPEEADAARLAARDLPIAEIARHRLNGYAAGEHALAGALRYFGRGDLEGEPLGEGVLRRYLESSLRAIYALDRLFKEKKYEAAVFHHGIYVPQGLVGEVARGNGVRVVNWNPAYRKQCFVFSHGDTYHRTMTSEPRSAWETMDWTPGREKLLTEYLQSRRSGSGDWIWFHNKPEENAVRIAEELRIDFSKPTVLLLTSVLWDAKLHYDSNAFSDMREWTIETIRYFARRPDLQLAIRIHPAEISGFTPSRQPMLDEIRRVFGELPKNVFVIGPESRVSTYALADQCDAALIYNTKTGIELSSAGIPVIVAGEAWIRGKGFSLDASSPGDYFEALDRLPFGARLDAEQTARAKKYAYHFFFRRMIPLGFIRGVEGRFETEYDLGSASDLKPGRHPGLDRICDGILNKEPFIFDGERE